MVEVRALQHPPHGVKLVIEAVSIMKEIKPKKVPGEKVGTKVSFVYGARGEITGTHRTLDSAPCFVGMFGESQSYMLKW